jgi:hypothetical protein
MSGDTIIMTLMVKMLLNKNDENPVEENDDDYLRFSE